MKLLVRGYLPATLLQAFCAVSLWAAPLPRLELELDAATAGPVALVSEKDRLPLSGPGGFRVYDATAKTKVDLSGRVTRQGKSSLFEATGNSVRLKATFTPKGDYLLVEGEIENLKGDNRGFIVDYFVPAFSAEAIFSNNLDQAEKMDRAEEMEANVFPIASMSSADRAIALAIPPTEPRIFGLVGSKAGMGLRLYLGVSPKPRKFPNRAPFTFIIYRTEPGQGFRGALSRYYALFPEYYQQNLKKEGIFMFQMVDRMPTNIDQYGFNLSEPQWTEEQIARALARDEKNNISTFPYMIVGQREIKFLPELPKNYDEAMKIYANWTLSDHGVRPLLKEAAAAQGDLFLKDEVDNSGCLDVEGRKVIVVRNTLWGEKSVTFKINPNPDLFADQGRRTTGSMALSQTEKWFKMHPEYDGMFVDSMGANWPAVLNYREDHFVYARYPLTFDPEGKVALQNDISHYEYIESLRKLVRKSNRLVLANGVYAYTSRGATRPTKASGGIELQQVNTTFNEFHAIAAPPEHYRAGTKLGRFFDSALFDAASSEFGVKATSEQCRDVRVLMGRKPYAFLNYHWDDQDKINVFVNRCLTFGIFASTSTNFFSGVIYETNPKGYLRDKPLLDWYVPLVRQITKAGWEPVRYAQIAGDSIVSERFGSGQTVYYTLFNDSDSARAATLSIDLAALGFKADKVAITEIAQKTPLTAANHGVVKLKLPPKTCYIIQVNKT